MRVSQALSRRSFVKRFTTGMVASAALGRTWRSPFVAEVQAAEGAIDGTLIVSLDDFPALENLQSSVRLGINPVADDHFPWGNHYPVLINRDLRGNFHVLDSECRHASCVVEAFDDFEQGLYCPCHHSLYGIDGEVIRGPSTRNLRKYPFHTEGDRVIRITLPGLGLLVTPSMGASARPDRFRLAFPTKPMVVYEVQFKPSMAGLWRTVSFATGEEGPADLTSILGVDGPMSLYVDRVGDSGFYQVVMQVTEV